MKNPLSYFVGILLAVLIVHPAIDYRIPMLVNSWHWLFIVCMAGLFGFYLLHTKIHAALKVLVIYLFANCFFSQVPYLGFNSFILIVPTFYFFILVQKCDTEIILKWIEAAFWMQVCLSIFQLADMDKLLCFDRAFELDETTLQIKAITTDIPKYVMFGTVMQYMRYASLLAVMTPFLLLRDRRYLILILILCAISNSSTFAFSLLIGGLVYAFLEIKKFWFRIGRVEIHIVHPRLQAFVAFLFLGGLYAALDWGSFRGAILPENGGRLITWLVIVKTWVLDTAHSVKVDPWGVTGPFNWQWFFLGHGADTFLPLFPIYKHDPNPFPQAHNSWLQMPWEIGAIGLGLVLAYLCGLIMRLYRVKAHDLIAGLACMGTNMFFAFPDRMMQTILLLVAYVSFCEIRIASLTIPKMFFGPVRRPS